MASAAMFAGLVFDEDGNAVEVSSVGQSACYVVLDDDFRRHVDAEEVDLQVLQFMRGQVDDHRDIAVETMLDMMGKDDLFTKAAVESSIDNMDSAVGQPIPEEARQWLGMLGFRVVIDFHGKVVDVNMPAEAYGGDDEF